MAIKNLSSLYDLIGDFGVAGGGPVNDMESQTGPNFPIVNGLERGAYPFTIPAGSGLHAGPTADTAGRSLLGPNYTYAYGGATGIAFAQSGDADLDLEGITPPLYKNTGPDEGFYGY